MLDHRPADASEPTGNHAMTRKTPREEGTPAEPGHVLGGRIRAQTHVPDRVPVGGAVGGGSRTDLFDEVGLDEGDVQ